MGVVLKVGRQRAFLRNGEWRCADAGVELLLNQTLQGWIEESGGPSLSSQEPEADAAREVARRVGGRILMSVPANRRQSQRDYFARRQYKLAFF
jgi:hypothetical protein